MKLTAAALALILSAGSAAAQISLEWDPNAPAEGVTGYKVWQKVTTPAVPPATEPVITWRLIGQTATPVTKFTVQKVPAGTTVYTVTAFSPGGESGRSNEASNTLLTAPGKLRVATVVVAP